MTSSDSEDLVSRVYEAVRVVEEAWSYLSPYAPTPKDILELVVDYIAATASRIQRDKQLVILEAGCGDGRVAALIAAKTLNYTLCVELDEKLVREARRYSSACVEVVHADLIHPPIRLPVDIAYAYLLPNALKHILDLNMAKILVTLDYYDPTRQPPKALVVGNHYLYVYYAG